MSSVSEMNVPTGLLYLSDCAYGCGMSNVYDRGRVPEFTLGDRLRKAREWAGVSTDEMAEVIDVSARTIGNYENDRTPVRGPVMSEWALRTGVPVEWIRTGIVIEHDDGGGLSVTPGVVTLAPVVQLFAA